MAPLGWTPRDFWAASMVELFAAIDGWNAANGGGGGVSGFTDDDREEVERLKRKYS